MSAGDSNDNGGLFFLVSLPVEGNEESTKRNLDGVVSQNASASKPFAIPKDLRVGTLDTLVALSDALVKDDTFGERLTRKLSTNMNNLVDGNKDKMLDLLQANGRTLQGYVEQFRWDSAKFNTALSADALRQDINKKLSEIDTEMKAKTSAYTKVKQTLGQMEKRGTGSLLVRDVSNVVTRDHFVLDSEYLVTLLVVVPMPKIPEWEESYETLSEYIVPRSSVRIQVDDKDSALYTVTMFRRVVEDFKQSAREKRFTVKDFEYDESKMEADEAKTQQLKTDLQRKYNMLVSWCKMAFSEAFIAWIHMKALRCFVESVLRYGLPVNFYSALVMPNAKRGPRLRKELNTAYARLDSSAGGGGDDGANVSVSGIFVKDYYPYVSFNIELASFL